MISKIFAFPCKESFTSCLYKTLGEEEIPLGRGNFSRCLTSVAAGIESILPERVNVPLCCSGVKCIRQGRDSEFWSWCHYGSGIWGQESSALT